MEIRDPLGRLEIKGPLDHLVALASQDLLVSLDRPGNVD